AAIRKCAVDVGAQLRTNVCPLEAVVLGFLKIITACPGMGTVLRGELVDFFRGKTANGDRIRICFSKRLEVPQITLELSAGEYFVAAADTTLRANRDWRESKTRK